MLYIKSHSGIIRSASMKNGEIRNFNNGVMVPIIKKGSYSGLSYDYKNRTVFYSDKSNFRIMHKELLQEESKIYLDKGIGSVGSIAVDWIGRNLFFIDETIQAIYVSKISDSSIRKVLISTSLNQPRSLVVAPLSGYFFEFIKVNKKKQIILY